MIKLRLRAKPASFAVNHMYSENRAFSVFSGQKSGTTIILSILQSFLHFLKAKDVNRCLK